MRCTPTVRLLMVLPCHQAYRCTLSTDYRPLGSCSRAAGWSAATLCFGTIWTISDVRRSVADGVRPDMVPRAQFGRPSRPREFHPEPFTDPDLILSHHPARAIDWRLPPSVELWAPPVASWPDSSSITPPPSLHDHYGRFLATTEQFAPLRRIGTFGLAVRAAWAFSL